MDHSDKSVCACACVCVCVWERGAWRRRDGKQRQNKGKAVKVTFCDTWSLHSRSLHVLVLTMGLFLSVTDFWRLLRLPHLLSRVSSFVAAVQENQRSYCRLLPRWQTLQAPRVVLMSWRPPLDSCFHAVFWHEQNKPAIKVRSGRKGKWISAFTSILTLVLQYYPHLLGLIPMKCSRLCLPLFSVTHDSTICTYCRVYYSDIMECSSPLCLNA